MKLSAARQNEKCHSRILTQLEKHSNICMLSVRYSLSIYCLTLVNSRKAIQDPVWKYIQTHEDVPFRVYNLDEAVYDAWSRIPRDELHSQADPRLTGFLHADMLVRLDELIVKRPLIQQDDMKQIGTLMLQRDKVARQAYYDAQHKKTRRKLKSVGDESIGSLLVEKFTKKASSIDTLAEIQKELNLTLARLEQEDGDENEAHSTPGPSAVDISLGKRHSNFVASSPHAKIRIGSSASSKLNYIINEVNIILCYPLIYELTYPSSIGREVLERREIPHILRVSFDFGPCR